MDNKEMMSLAERIACRHQKLSTTQVTELCLKIKSAYDTMVASDAPAPTPMAVWSGPDTVNCRCYVKPVTQPVGVVIRDPLTEAPPMPGSEPIWRAVVDLNEKQWRDDDVIEISYGLDGDGWRGTVQEYRTGKFLHVHSATNKWRFLQAQPNWLQCLNVKHRPRVLDDVADNTTFVAMYANGPAGNDAGYTHLAERLSDINWTTVLAVKRVLE